MEEPLCATRQVVVGPAGLLGDLTLPSPAKALLLFAHGSGSSRHSPRSLQVAQALQQQGFGTLLFDLLTPAETRDRAKVFDIGLPALRLAEAIRWVDRQPALSALPLALFGASTGAAAALRAAAELPERVDALVSRRGRPDLAGDALGRVMAPTLFIVGSRDLEVLALNRRAMRQMQTRTQLSVIPGAGHLFEETGALAQVAELAAGWLAAQLPHPSQGAVHDPVRNATGLAA